MFWQNGKDGSTHQYEKNNYVGSLGCNPNIQPKIQTECPIPSRPYSRIEIFNHKFKNIEDNLAILSTDWFKLCLHDV